MHSPEEIAAIKRRLGTLEYEFRQLQRLVERLDAGAVSPPPPEPVVAPLEPAPAEPPMIALPVSVPPPPEPVAAPPPPLPPVITSEPPRIYEPVAPQPHPWREWLEPLQLWPPAGEDNAEVRLAAWWATRVGALLAVIGIVFLGIYVSRDAANWVRLAEVMAVTGAVIGLGSWLERKLPTFGAVVFGAGLALAYFCAFAAYAVKPMQVITNPLVASTCELVVVGGILALAWRRQSQLVATMAVALGYVTAFLALRHETVGFGAWVVLLLGIASVVLRLARAWDAPSALAMPLTWIFLGAASIGRGPGLDISLTATWVWTSLHLVLFMARDWIVARRGAELSTLDRALQVTNSSLAVVVGLMAALRVGGDHTTEFFFASGVIMLLSGWVWREAGARPLVPIYVCKGAGLIALGIIDAFAGQARCLILLAQAFVMLVSARHSHQRWLRTATVLTGILALAFFIEELRPDGATFLDQVTALEILFLAGAVGFVAALRRWLDYGITGTTVASALMGVVAVGTASRWQLHGWNAAVDVGLAVILMLAAVPARGWLVAGIAGGILVGAGHAEIWLFHRGQFPADVLWGGELALLGASFAAAAAVRRVTDLVAQARLRWFIAALSVATLIAACFKGLDPVTALVASVGIAVVLIGAAPLVPKWNFAALSAPAIALACVFLFERAPRGADNLYWLAMLGAWAAPLWLVSSRTRLESIVAQDWRAAASAVHTVLATVITLLAIQANLHGSSRLLAVSIAAIVAAGIAWRPGLRPALEASWVFWCATLVLVMATHVSGATWFAAVLCWVPAILLARVEQFQPLRAVPPPWRARADAIQVALAAIIGGVVALDYAGTSRFVAFAAVIALAFAVWRMAGVSSARPATVALTAVAWICAMMFSVDAGAQGWGTALAAVLGVAALVTLLPFALNRDLDPVERARVHWMAAAMGLGLAFLVLNAQRGEVAPYVTVGCGIAAVATFLTGLIGRSRPHRLWGLAGLILWCVPRAFVVDLHSTLHRIAAFVALGVVFLWVGFSYHRFRHLIVEEKKKL